MYKEYHYTRNAIAYKCYYFADEHERLRDMHTMRHHSEYGDYRNNDYCQTTCFVRL